MDIPSDLKLWRKNAREEQEEFFRNLKCNGDYHIINSPWEPGISSSEKNFRNLMLRMKIGFGLYGIPQLKKRDSFADTGYSNYQGHRIKDIVKIIKSSSNCDTALKIAPIMILSRKDRKCKAEIIFRFQAQDSDFPTKFIDSRAKLYQNWEKLLESHLLEDHDYSYPTNGLYSKPSEGASLSIEFRKAVIDATEQELPSEIDYLATQHPELFLIDPLKMDFTEQGVFLFLSSVNFFLNQFYDIEELWDHLQLCMAAVRDEIKKTLSNENKNTFMRLCEENPIGHVIRCIGGGVDQEKLLTDIRNVKVNFLPHGLISVNDYMEISPLTLQELKKDYRELVLSNRYQRRDIFSKLFKPELISKPERNQCVEAITKALSYYTKTADSLREVEINGCKIFKNMEFYLPERLYKILHDTCQNFNHQLIAFSFRMATYQKCSNSLDFCSTMEFAVAYVMKEKAQLEAEYNEALMQAEESEEAFKLSIFRENYGIPKDMKNKEYFLQKALESLNKQSDYEINASFDDLKLNCHDEVIQYNFKFSDDSTAAYHCFKHRKFGNVELTEQEYFALANKLLEKAPNETFRVQDGGSFCEVFEDGNGPKLIRYRSSVTNPDGSVEDKCVVATLMHVRSSVKETLDNPGVD